MKCQWRNCPNDAEPEAILCTKHRKDDEVSIIRKFKPGDNVQHNGHGDYIIVDHTDKGYVACDRDHEYQVILLRYLDEDELTQRIN